MDCKEARRNMHLVIDKECQEPTDEHALSSHCSVCTNCKSEYEMLSSLKNRMHTFTANVQVPTDLEARLRSRLAASDAGGNQANNKVFKFPLLQAAVAAAFVVAILSAVHMLFSQPAGTLQIASRPAHADDLVAQFQENTNSQAPRQPVDLKNLTPAAGFAIKPPSLKGFQLADAQICNIAGTRFVRLAYKGQFEGKDGTLACFICPNGNFDATGLDVHLIGGRKVCCGQLQTLSLVYMPSPSTDYVLIAAAPKAQLMELALKS